MIPELRYQSAIDRASVPVKNARCKGHNEYLSKFLNRENILFYECRDEITRLLTLMPGNEVNQAITVLSIVCDDIFQNNGIYYIEYA